MVNVSSILTTRTFRTFTTNRKGVIVMSSSVIMVGNCEPTETEVATIDSIFHLCQVYIVYRCPARERDTYTTVLNDAYDCALGYTQEPREMGINTLRDIIHEFAVTE